jgi:hypothetical protein
MARRRVRVTKRTLGLVLLLLGALLQASPAYSQSTSAIDCVGPAGDPQPGTPAWYQREADNAYCGEQRAYDTASNPLFASGWVQMEARHHGEDFRADPFRDPLMLRGSRFRYRRVRVPAPSGGTIPGMLFRPCNTTCRNRPSGLRAYKPPFPGVVIVHGGAANQEMYLWGAEGLAEAGTWSRFPLLVGLVVVRLDRAAPPNSSVVHGPCCRFMLHPP